jgi:calcineurin-like phosphoesterase
MGLPTLLKKTHADLVVANGENAADGLGLTPEIAGSLFKSGVEVITSGNHIWQRREILPLLDGDGRILRPENYPTGVPGRGSLVLTRREVNVAVVNVVDFHAESPEEKEALAIHLDGTVSAVLGTHTHVQTADERVLPGGTAYIGDVGMTGPRQGVIGMKREISIRRSLTQIPIKMEVENSDGVIRGALVEVNPADGKALSIQRIAQDA